MKRVLIFVALMVIIVAAGAQHTPHMIVGKAWNSPGVAPLDIRIKLTVGGTDYYYNWMGQPESLSGSYLSPPSFAIQTMNVDLFQNMGDPAILTIQGDNDAEISFDITRSSTSVTNVGEHTFPTNVGTLSLSPSPVEFGDVEMSGYGQQNLTISAIGDPGAQVTISSLDFTGDAVFSIMSPPTLPYTMTVPDELVLTLEFNPPDMGNYTGVLTVTDDNAESYPVDLNGNGVYYPVSSWIEPDPESLVFGSVPIGTPSSMEVRLDVLGDNDMPQLLTIAGMDITGSSAFVASFTPPFSAPFDLMPGDNHVVNVTFTPYDPYEAFADLYVHYNGDQFVIIPLYGSGYLPTASLMVVPMSIVFGEVELLTPVEQSVRVYATGDPGAQITITSIDLAGDSVFTMATPPVTPYLMTVPDSLDITVYFTPEDVIGYGATLTIADNTASSYLISISGSGYHNSSPSVLSATPPDVDFGYIDYGSSTEQGIVIECIPDPVLGIPLWVNSLVVTGDAGFSAMPMPPDTTPFLMNPYDVRVLYVTYEPAFYGNASAILDVYYDGGTTGQVLSVPLAGYCEAPGATLEITPLYVDFGSWPVSETTYAEIVLSATGVASSVVTISNIEMSDDQGFSIVSAPPTPLLLTTPETATVIVAFHPDVAGPYNAELEIGENYAYSHFIPLSGTGFNPTVVTGPDFSATPVSGHAPLTVQFTDTSSMDPYDPTTTIEGWRWDFDFNGTVDSFQQNPTWEYTQPGIYSVKLTVFTSTGQVHEVLKENYINASNQAPLVIAGAATTLSFDEDVVGGPWSLATIFTDPDGDALLFEADGSTHLGAEIVSNNWLWLHPDENWNGTEYITLTARDPFDASVSHSIAVTVIPVNDAPIMDIPPDMYFIHNSVFTVDFAHYITDPDNTMDQLSISLQHIAGPADIGFIYYPVNTPNLPGQFQVKFSTAQQNPMVDSFQITVNDNTGRAIAQEIFDMHLIDHFEPVVELGDVYQFAGQTVLFFDATLGNPDWWDWQFGDTQTSDMQDPEHTYPLAGTYDITLTLGNSEANEQATVFLPGLFTLVGTSVTPGNIPAVWDSLASPFNLFGEVEITSDMIISIQPNVEVNLFDGNSLLILGTLNAHRARFRPQGGEGQWGGLKFFGGGNFRIPSDISDCDIIDALLPIDIEDSSPNLSGVTIALSDTTSLMEGPGLRITGGSAPVIRNLQINNYTGGLILDSDGTADRTTPTLSNIRVRNSGESSRAIPDGSTGVAIYSNATIDTLEIENYATGLVISGDSRDRSTPTLSNIRVRNSGESSRTTLLGMSIIGGIAPQINNLDISGVNNGIFINGSGDERSTPTLSNIRVRNSGESSRSDDFGIGIENIGSLVVNTGEITGFYHGVRIDNAPNILGTPTLSNIRIRNSAESSRQENIGLEINGPVAITLTGSRIEDYPFGIKYEGSGRYGLPSIKISQTVVRNTLQHRLSSIGIQLHNLGRVVCRDDSIGGFNVGLEVLNDGAWREFSTPALNNLKIVNTEENIRFDNAGIFLGPHVAGSISGCEVSGAKTGIMIADGNTTSVLTNRIRDCEIGVKGASTDVPKAISRQEVLLDQAFAAAHPAWDFHAFDVSLAGPWTVHNNTVVGYPKLLRATNTTASFYGNIGWGSSFLSEPFTQINSGLLVGWNDLYTAVPWPGTGNINLDPLFTNPATMDYHISYNSPCVDAGGTELLPDPDGSISDIGAYNYPHRSDFVASERFIQTGTTVRFTNTSLGHGFPFSTAAWDLNSDGSIEATSGNWEYTFNTPGMYSVRLTMSSGTLQDIRTYYAYIVVQNHLLRAPQNVHITTSAGSVNLNWEPVELTLAGIPISVEYYIVYSSQTPNGLFDFVGYTTNFVTNFSTAPDPATDRMFYVVLGYSGSLRQVLDFIRENRQYKVGNLDTPVLRSSRE